MSCSLIRDRRRDGGRSRFDERAPADREGGNAYDANGAAADGKPSKGRANRWESSAAAEQPLPGPPPPPQPRREGQMRLFITQLTRRDPLLVKVRCFFCITHCNRRVSLPRTGVAYGSDCQRCAVFRRAGHVSTPVYTQAWQLLVQVHGISGGFYLVLLASRHATLKWQTVLPCGHSVPAEEVCCLFFAVEGIEVRRRTEASFSAQGYIGDAEGRVFAQSATGTTKAGTRRCLRRSPNRRWKWSQTMGSPGNWQRRATRSEVLSCCTMSHPRRASPA